jgi:hypothetical protein
MFSVRRRGLCAIAALVTGATLAGGLAAPAAMASTGPKAAPGTDSTVTIRAGGVRTAEHGGLDLTKTAWPRTYTHAGEQVTYTYSVTNTEHFTLHDVHVTDDHVNGPISCTPSRIATGQTATCTATYTITGADVRRGHVTNTARAIGKTPHDQYVSSRPADATVRAKKQKAAIGLVKSAAPHAYGAPGQTITYTYRVTNTGDVPLHSIMLDDNKLGAITCPRTTLTPGKSMTCTATYTTTQRDVRAGHIDNSAIVIGHPRKGRPVIDTDRVRIVAHRHPGIQLEKVASPTGYARAGQLISYTYTVTNTGTVALWHITLTDDKLGAITCPKPALAPGKSMTCHATYVTTQADVDAGRIANSATVTGHPHKGHPVTGTATAVVTAVQHPGIALAKWAHPATYERAGQRITYTYRVTNTGDVTLHGITLTDNKIHGPIACPMSALAPGKSMTCHAVHTTTRADVRAGHIKNVAMDAGWPPRGGRVTARAEADVVARTLPVVPVTG